MQDPIADMISRINNAKLMKKVKVSMPSSALKVAVAVTLKDEGYIENFHEEVNGPKKTLTIVLKYVDGKCAITKLSRVSKPGLRQYSNVADIPRVIDGYGIAILSTSKGVMSDEQARKNNVGGELLCEVF
jgi:small subunit ribosomal protein S8